MLANPGAGGGTRQAGIAARLRDAWAGHELFGATGFGGEVFPHSPAPLGGGGYLPRLHGALDALLAQGIELLVLIGGDGTSAYAADYLVSRGVDIPLLGIGAGTANAGPIVTLGAEDELPAPEALTFARVGAVEALTPDGAHIAYGFNDVVLSNTLLGTLDGKAVTLDASRLAREGRAVPAPCLEDIAEERLAIEKNGASTGPIPAGIAQLVASTLERERFYGRAVTGMLCHTPGSPHQAAAFLSTRALVSHGDSPAGYETWMWGGQLLLRPEDALHIHGLRKEVCAVADGNPYLLGRDGVALRYVPGLITVAQGRR